MFSGYQPGPADAVKTETGASGVLDEDYVFTEQHINSAISAKINCHILASVMKREEDDRKHYAKVSASLEKRKRQ